MSEIRPANNRPNIPQVQQERPVRTEQRDKEVAPQKTVTQRELVKHEANQSKPKGGNVDITV